MTDDARWTAVFDRIALFLTLLAFLLRLGLPNSTSGVGLNLFLHLLFWIALTLWFAGRAMGSGGLYRFTGFEFALRGRAKEAERALEEACLARFGTLRPNGSTPVVRSDNGLIFQSRRFRAACRDYRLRQEFITPYTPEQNGIVERFVRSRKEACVWQHNFRNFTEARAAITQWIHWYNAERPHQALGYRSPRQFRALQPQLVA